MTGGTTARHSAMLEIGRLPGIGCVAIRTVVGTEDVFRGLAFHNPVIVAIDATTQDVGMVYDGSRFFPAANLMTALTDIGRIDMLGVLAACIHPIVTSKTITHHAIMIVGDGIPGERIVAILTGSTICRDMGG